MAHCYYMWNIIVIAINFCNAKKIICALMFIISNHDGIKCISNHHVVLFLKWFLT